MKVYGGNVIPSPSNTSDAGRRFLADNPNSHGSLGMAISEACETAINKADTKYVLGSVLNFVMLHQTIIGLEAEIHLSDFYQITSIYQVIWRI